jgi:hypothetical protein
MLESWNPDRIRPVRIRNRGDAERADAERARLRWNDMFRAAPTAENPGFVLIEVADALSGQWASVEIGTGNVEDFS